MSYWDGQFNNITVIKNKQTDKHTTTNMQANKQTDMKHH